MDKIIYQPPEDYKKHIDESFIELVGKLFIATILKPDGTIDKKPLPVRFVRGSDSDCMILILGENKSLWFTKKDGEWIYDGWEFGDYSQSWKETSIQ